MLISGSVVAGCLVTLFFMLGMHAWASVTGSFTYEIPAVIVNMLTTIFGTACTVLSVGVTIAFREEYEYEKEQGLDRELPAIEKAVETIVDAEIVPEPTWDGEISLQEIEGTK